jgi:hypothetical protein
VTQVAATSDPAASTVVAGKPFEGAIKLNAFQALMRRWSRMHPYNAGQVMEITGAPDLGRWKHAVESVIGEMGFGKPRFSDNDTVVEFSPAGEATIEQSQQDLSSFFNDELNRPFAAGDLPLRFCVLPHQPSNGHGVSHYFAAVYDHWIGDSRAMRELMHRIYDRYQHPEGSRLPPLTLDAPNFNKLFRKHVGRLSRMAAIRESIKNVWRHRHGFRVNIAEPVNFNSGFLYRILPPGLIEKVYRDAKSSGASVNDLFIAAVGQTLGAFTAAERARRKKKAFHFRRGQIGIGTIVDIRDSASEPLDRVFNLYLSSYTVLLKNPEHRPLDSLMKEVARKTRHIKKTFATVKGFWALVMARFWYDTYDVPRFQAQLLHKAVPVVAGISNVNMTGSWADVPPPAGKAGEDTPRILDYLRISPTGPLSPLVFTLTTIRDRLSLCITYRTTAFTDAEARALADDFVKRLSGG